MKKVLVTYTKGIELPDFYPRMERLLSYLREIEGICLLDQSDHPDLCIAVLDHCKEDPSLLVQKVVTEYSKRDIFLWCFNPRGTIAPVVISEVINKWRFIRQKNSQEIHIYDNVEDIVRMVKHWVEDSKPKDPTQ